MEPIIISASFFQEQPSLGVLGRTGEHEARRISFDCGEVLKTWPEATILCVCRRPCDTAAYPIPLTADGTTYTMPLTSRETAAAGTIKLELRAVRNDTVLKSAIFYGRILPSLNGQKDAPGNPLSDALNRLESTIANAQTLADEIRQKLDNGEFVGERGPQGEPGERGPQGDKGDKGVPGADGSDATVTAENIQSALGYAPVKDVQVAGSSVLEDGVANVPIATKTVNGVMRPDFYGVGVSATGILYVQNTSNINITNRVSSAPLTAYNLDYAVKAAMCDGKGAAWTSDEQKTARERMGVDKAYELIEEITLAEETGVIERDTEPDGRAYNFTELKCLVIGKNSSGNNVYYALTSNRLNKLPVSIFSISGSDASYRSLAEISCAGAIVVGTGTNAAGYNVVQSTMLGTYNVLSTIYWPSGKIEGFILRPQNAQNPGQLMTGTKIMIYGVRA